MEPVLSLQVCCSTPSLTFDGFCRNAPSYAEVEQRAVCGILMVRPFLAVALKKCVLALYLLFGGDSTNMGSCRFDVVTSWNCCSYYCLHCQHTFGLLECSLFSLVLLDEDVDAVQPPVTRAEVGVEPEVQIHAMMCVSVY